MTLKLCSSISNSVRILLMVHLGPGVEAFLSAEEPKSCKCKKNTLINP